MRKTIRFLSLLALLITAATGAWAKAASVIVTHSDQTVSNYGSLAEAFAQTGSENANLQDGDVVTLLDDQTELTDILHLKNKQITLDLNGHTVSSSNDVFSLTGTADLTLTSSQEDAAVSTTGDNCVGIVVTEGCELTIPASSQHFTVSSNYTAIGALGEVVIAGSPTISAKTYAISSSEVYTHVELTISGSPTITSDVYGIYMAIMDGQVTISGAPTISGKANGILALCPVTISGQPKISSQGAAGQMGAIVPYDILAIPLTIGGTTGNPATIDFTGSKATGNILMGYFLNPYITGPINITGPVALGGDHKWTVAVWDNNTTPINGTVTSGWAANMNGADPADYFAGGQLSDGTNLTVTADADGEGFLNPVYTLSLADNTADAANWQGSTDGGDSFADLPMTEVEAGDEVTLKYNGRRKVKSVTATTDAAPEEPVTLATPLTMEVTAPGTIYMEIPGPGNTTLFHGLKYSINGGEKNTLNEGTNNIGTNDNPLMPGTKVQFYGDGNTSLSNIFVDGDGDEERKDYIPVVIGGGTATVKVYGNIMSMLDGDNFATNYATLPDGSDTFSTLFGYNTKLTDASGLLLPATKLAPNCYTGMFNGCTALTRAPKLPATTLTEGCYQNMFKDCKRLTTAPVLPAPTLAKNCYWMLFYGCSKLRSITCLATVFNEAICDWVHGVAASGTFTKAAAADWPESMSGYGIPIGWTVVDAPSD